MADNFNIPLPAALEAPNAIPMDEAVDAACGALGFPVLGGPSGSGWSMYSVSQRCPHLYRRKYVDAQLRLDEATAAAARAPAVPLQVGGLYHSLQGLYYAAGLGEAVAHERGIISAEIWSKSKRKAGRPKKWTAPADAADQLLRSLNEAVQLDFADPHKRLPSGAVLAEAEKAFDAHTSYYGEGREDVTPLAIEWLAVNAALGYTCRYDMIGRIGPDDPLGLPAGSVVAYERKTAAYLSEMTKTGWINDGEVLGEIMNWEPSGCRELFGPLAAVVVDIVTKSAKPVFLRIVIPPDVPAAAEHGKWIRYMQSQVHLWGSTGVYPKYFASCFDKWGKCSEWDNCTAGAR